MKRERVIQNDLFFTLRSLVFSCKIPSQTVVCLWSSSFCRGGGKVQVGDRFWRGWTFNRPCSPFFFILVFFFRNSESPTWTFVQDLYPTPTCSRYFNSLTHQGEHQVNTCVRVWGAGVSQLLSEQEDKLTYRFCSIVRVTTFVGLLSNCPTVLCLRTSESYWDIDIYGRIAQPYEINT